MAQTELGRRRFQRKSTGWGGYLSWVTTSKTCKKARSRLLARFGRMLHAAASRAHFITSGDATS